MPYKAKLEISTTVKARCTLKREHDVLLLSDIVRMKAEGSMANRPDNTAFTQQRLPAWQPILSAGIVIPGFTFIGLAFIGIGVALFVTSQNIKMLEVDKSLQVVFKN